jgi:peptidoglycan-N-acetylglucosamine deacetylase
LAKRSPAVAAAALLLALLSGCAASPTSAILRHLPRAATPTSPTRSPKPTPRTKPAPKPTPSRTATFVPVSARGVQRGHGPAGSLISTGSRGVALTFDDGPDPVYTPMLLDLLKKYHVKATFCVVGFRARDHADLIRRIIAEGHTICNHSWQHLMDLGADSRTDAYILHDLQATNNAIRAAVPGARIRYFRAPGGKFTPRLVALARSLGMTSIYWAVDPQDWNHDKYGYGATMVDHIIANVEYNVRPGSIVLSHDLGKPDTITAYRTLLPWLRSHVMLIRLPT